MKRWNLLDWGRAVFTRDATSSADPSLWREKLAQVQESGASEAELEDGIEITLDRSGPDYVAAICVRDHWDELSEEQRTWCANRVCAAAVADADTSDEFAIAGRNPLDGSRPAAFVLSALLNKVLPSVLQERLIEALAITLTHPVTEIVEYAVRGVGRFLWDTDRELALTCVGALAEQARKYGAFLKERVAHHRFDPAAEESFRRELRQDTRSRINSQTSFPEQTLLDANLGEQPAQAALPLLLAMLTPRPEEPLARSLLKLLVQQIAGAWTHAQEGRRDRRRGMDREDYLDPDRISGLNEFVASFTLRLPLEVALALVEPILAAIPHHPKEVAEFLDWLITVEDRRPSGGLFWAIWQAAADRFVASDLVAYIDMEHSEAAKLLKTLFFNTNWKDTARDWAPLHGNEQRIQNLFNTVSPSRAVLSAYACFLYKIGAITLPLPLVAIAAKLQGRPLFLSEEAVFYLERILARLIQGGSSSMLARDDVRQAVLFLLDELVEQGSSTAYKLRDDFVTPRP
jgi:hypothetical protein